MQAFQWDTCFLTGLPTVDEQHHGLVDLINQFGDALMRSTGVRADEVEKLFQALKRYTLFHFQEEEALMQERGVYPIHIAHHHQEHAQFVEDLVQMRAQMHNDDPAAAAALLNYLSNWLAFHILGTDRLMTWLMQAVQDGVPAKEALEAFNKTRDPATATLLQAMNKLVIQVSERNRALLELNQTLEARVTDRTQALQTLNERLEVIAMTDVLTSLPNRRQAMQVLAREWQTSTSSGAPLACMMIDADGFKQINDTYGHDAGDEVLKALSRCLQDAVRNDDLVCRLGGDEFLIICANTALDGALHTAKKVHRDVAALRVPAGSGCWTGSVSIGVAERTSQMTNFEALLKAADNGVYAAKANGRNRVCSLQDGAVA